MSLLLSMILLGGALVRAQDTPRMALLYSDYRPMDRTFLDPQVEPLGWQLDRWNVAECRRLMQALPQYDLMMTSACWNFTPGMELKPDHRYPGQFSPRLLGEWLQNGGGLIASMSDDGAGDQWLRKIEPSLSFSVGKCDFDDIDPNAKPDAVLGTDLKTASWLHFHTYGEGWKALHWCEHGKATVLWREQGKGFIFATILVGTFYQSENLAKMWDWLKQREGRATRAALDQVPILPLPPASVQQIRSDSRSALHVWDEDEFALARVGMSEKLTNRSLLTERAGPLKLAGARNEWVCGQVALVPKRAGGKYTVTTEGFEGCRAEAKPVQYLTWTKGELRAEVVSNSNQFSVPQSVTGVPIWLRVYIPEGTPKGTVRGKLIVTGSRQTSSIPVELEVYAFSIPKQQHVPSDFAFRPGLLWGYYNQTPWHQEGPPPWWEHMTFERYAEWRRLMMQYRITPQGYMDAPNPSISSSMTSQLWVDGEWDGETWTPDWTRFDAHISDCFECGAAMVRVGYTGGPDPEHERWRFWRSYLPQLERHVREKGWEQRVYIYQMDEVRKHMWETFAVRAEDIARLAPSVKRLTVLQSPFPKELDGFTDIWCPSMGVFGTNRQRARDLQNIATEDVWCYVCTSGAPPYSELFMQEPGLNHRLLPWIIWRYDIQGLLYYGVAFWSQQYKYDGLMIDEDGNLDEDWGFTSGHFSGGGCLIYPGGPTIESPPQVSLRLELLRQGLQDYEYFWLLRDLVARNRGTWWQRMRARSLLEVPDKIVSGVHTFTDDEAKLDAHKRKIARAIEKLQGGK